MKFLNLTLKNFLSFQDKVELKLNNKGIVLIEGINQDASGGTSNGSGKSALVTEGLFYVLYGETLRGQKADEVVNETVGKNCSVSLTLEADKCVYTIKRYRKHSEHKNSLQLFIKNFDGSKEEDITGATTSTTQEKIEELLGMSKSSFIHSTFSSPSLIQTFSTKTDREQKEVLENLLSVEEIQLYLERTKRKLNGLKNELSQLIRSQEQLETQKQTIEERVVSYKLKQKSEKVEQESLIKEKQGTVQEYKESLTIKTKEKTEQTLRLNAIEELFDELPSITEDKIELLRSKIKQKEKEISTLESEIKAHEREHLLLNNEITSTESIQEDTCPLCGNQVTEEKKDELNTNRKQRQEELKKQTQEIKEDQTGIQSLIDNIQEEVHKEIQKNASITEEKDELQQKKTTLTVSIARITNDINFINQKKEDMIESIKEIKNKESAYTALINEANKKVEELEIQNTEVKKQTDKCTDTIKYYEFWERGFGNQGIKSFIFDTVTPLLNKYTSEYLSVLSQGSVRVTFDTQTTLTSGEVREKFSINLHNTFGSSTYKGCSKGQRRRVDIAITLAIHKIAQLRAKSKFGLLILDEIDDGLDVEGMERIIELITLLGKDIPSLFVVTHSDALKDYFDNKITVIMSQGKSYVSTKE